MREIEKLVKDKALFYWLDTEITMMQIPIYWILALLIDKRWALWVAGIMTVINLIYTTRVEMKIKALADKSEEPDNA